RVLRRHVPAAVPGIVFLSGGQDERSASAHLNAMNTGPEERPWRVSFSYGRALQDQAIEAWGGRASGAAARREERAPSARSNSGRVATARRAWAGTMNRWSGTRRTSRWRRTGLIGPTTESRSVGMSTTRRAGSVKDTAALLKQYGCGPIELTGTDNALYERHLLFDNIILPAAAGARERYEAFARSVRDILSQRWVHTESTYERQNPKQVSYLSMEFLIGRSLTNNITNLLLDPVARQAVKQKDLDWLGLVEEEPDAGLGNGGLGRLAACFLDSMA